MVLREEKEAEKKKKDQKEEDPNKDEWVNYRGPIRQRKTETPEDDPENLGFFKMGFNIFRPPTTKRKVRGVLRDIWGCYETYRVLRDIWGVECVLAGIGTGGPFLGLELFCPPKREVRAPVVRLVTACRICPTSSSGKFVPQTKTYQLLVPIHKVHYSPTLSEAQTMVETKKRQMTAALPPGLFKIQVSPSRESPRVLRDLVGVTRPWKFFWGKWNSPVGEWLNKGLTAAWSPTGRVRDRGVRASDSAGELCACVQAGLGPSEEPLLPRGQV
eukprot:4071684-Pyramimonas_sp.AAC.2